METFELQNRKKQVKGKMVNKNDGILFVLCL